MSPRSRRRFASSRQIEHKLTLQCSRRERERSNDRRDGAGVGGSGNRPASVRLSVRPSVRPCVQEFLSPRQASPGPCADPSGGQAPSSWGGLEVDASAGGRGGTLPSRSHRPGLNLTHSLSRSGGGWDLRSRCSRPAPPAASPGLETPCPPPAPRWLAPCVCPDSLLIRTLVLRDWGPTPLASLIICKEPSRAESGDAVRP